MFIVRSNIVLSNVFKGLVLDWICTSQGNIRVTAADENGYMIHGIAVLSHTRILVADFTNNTLRLVDSVHGGVVSKLSLQGSPWRICLSAPGIAAVALKKEGLIQFIQVDSDTMSLICSISVRGHIAGIAAMNNLLVVSYKSPDRVELISMEGQVLKMTYNIKEVFEYSYFMATSTDGFIFIANYGTNTITQLDTNLRVVKTFTSPILRGPAGIVYVSPDQMVVVGAETHNIVTLNTKNGTMSPLLGRADGLQDPWPGVLTQRRSSWAVPEK